MKKLFLISFLFISLLSHGQLLNQRQFRNYSFSSLTDGTTITWDMQTGHNRSVTIAGNRTLSITNAISGDYGTILVTQDGTGGHTLAVPNATVVLDGTQSHTTVLSFTYDGSTFYWAGGVITYVDTIYRTVGKDSIQFTIDGRYHAILDSAGGGITSLTVGTTPITSGTDTRLLYQSGTVLQESANLIFNSSSELIVGATDNGAYTLQSNGGLYVTGGSGSNFIVGQDLGMDHQITINRTASGDNLISNWADNTGGVSSLVLKDGNGTTAVKFAYVSFQNNNTTALRWDFGLYGAGTNGNDIVLKDVTDSKIAMEIASSTGFVGAQGVTSPTSALHTTSFAAGYVAKSADYTLGAADYLVEVTATGHTFTLPTAVGITGRIYTVKVTSATSSATVNTTSSQTIDGSTTYSLASQYKYVSVMSNGANWIVIANN